MEAKELRIGNYVNYRNEPILIDTNYNMFKMLVDVSRKDERITPIPLTEDWLLKMGLKLGYISDKFQIEKYEGIFYFTINEYEDESAGYDIEVKYVHKLQNLYFALTNTELVIQDEK